MRTTRNIRENKPLPMIHNLLLPSSRFLLILASCVYLNLPSRPVTATSSQFSPSSQTVLSLGMRGSEVQVLQIQLKALGFYKDVIDGNYRQSTRNAVTDFQKAKGLKRIDGVADLTTQIFLTQAISGKMPINNSSPTTPQSNINNNTQTNIQSATSNQNTDFVWWSLLGLGLLVTVGTAMFFMKKFSQISQSPKIVTQKLLRPSSDNNERLFLKSAQVEAIPIPTDLVPLETTNIIPKLNTCEELMKELQCDNSKIRRKAIWKLGEEGDSRAVQPLVDLMIDADSEQQGLILSTLAEIGTRTLKPMNRALAISLRDENPQVRKNAIRDLVRIYEMMGKMSKIVLHAMEDPDPEVQATAKYALSKMNRIPTIPEQHILTEMQTEES